MSDAPKIVLYGREGCHLCDEARDALLRMGEEGIEFELIEVDDIAGRGCFAKRDRSQGGKAGFAERRRWILCHIRLL